MTETEKHTEHEVSGASATAERRATERTDRVRRISGLFLLKKTERVGKRISSPSSLYNTMAFLCAMKRIPIIKYKKLVQICGETFSPADVARLSRFLCREIDIDETWKGPEIGSALLRFEDDTEGFAACFRRFGRVVCRDSETGEKTSLRSVMEHRRILSCYIIERALPARAVTWKDIFKFSLAETRLSDAVTILLGTLLSTFAGLQYVALNKLLCGTVVSTGSVQLLLHVTLYITACMAGGVLFRTAQSVTTFRMTSRIRYALQSALYNRLFHMREKYFREQESAQIAYRLESTLSLYSSALTASVSALSAVLSAVLYLRRMYTYSQPMTRIGVALILIGVIFVIVIGNVFQKYQTEKSAVSGRMRSFLFQILSIMQSVRLHGAAEEVEDRYLALYTKYGELQLKNGRTQRLSDLVISLAGSSAIVVSYFLMAEGKQGINTSVFLAFLSAFGAFTGVMAGLAQNVRQIIISAPALKRSSGILQETPESSVSGIVPDSLKGQIKLANVSFAYGPGEPPVLRNLSLNIERGEYIGIAGTSGCGKSTLLRLLLGFEQPASGKIYYDHTDLAGMNLVEHRRRIGTVLQDGVLFPGTILDNIKICRPQATMEEVIAAAETADIRADIEKMPMSYLTPVSEQAHTLSGGQKQRIMIARAILSQPSVLLLDEATSALDNLSQTRVVDRLAELHCTRIVVAHRLSTLEKCDRIVVLDRGTVVECGTYGELMQHKGVFYTLAQNQLVVKENAK